MRLKALSMYTNDLPNLTFSIPTNLVGNSTEECIYSGVFFGVFYEMKRKYFASPSENNKIHQFGLHTSYIK